MEKKFFGAGKVMERGQITIPKEIRDILKIKVGDYLLFYEDKGKVLIERPK